MSKVKVYACGDYKTKPEEQELFNKIFALEEKLVKENPEALVAAHEVWRELFGLPDVMFTFARNCMSGRIQIVLFPVRPGAIGSVHWDPVRYNWYLETKGE